MPELVQQDPPAAFEPPRTMYDKLLGELADKPVGEWYLINRYASGPGARTVELAEGAKHPLLELRSVRTGMNSSELYGRVRPDVDDDEADVEDHPARNDS
jgi:hypothetical protein